METAFYETADEKSINAVAQILRNGGIAAIPTETVYGLGANAYDENACSNVFKAKGRPGDNPLIVHISDLNQINDIVTDFPQKAKILADKFWPGPLTMIMKKSDRIPLVTSGGLDTVAVRFPSHPVAHEIIKKAGVPIAAPSANLSGSPSPTTYIHCVKDLSGRVDAIINGGPCDVGVESTIISFASDVPILLRPGYITLEQLRDAIGTVSLSKAVLEKLGDGETALSPGMKYKHYAPKGTVIMVKGEPYVDFVNKKFEENENTAALCFTEDIDELKCKSVSMGNRDDDLQQAERLFDALRTLDDMEAKLVYARAPKITGVGLAVYNRLIRACGFEIIEL